MNSAEMTILYISHTSEMHGSGRALFNMVKQFSLLGIEATVVMPFAHGKLFDELAHENVNIAIQPVVSWIWPQLKSLRDCLLFPYRFSRLMYKSVRFYCKLLFLVKKLSPDLIHTNVGTVHIGSYIAKKCGIKHIWHIREYQDLYFGWYPFPSKRKFHKLLLQDNNYPIAITKGVYEHYNMQSNKNAIIIYDGVFDVDIVPLINYQKKKYFLFVGLISEGKGTIEAINAFLSVSSKYPECELHIAGGGNESYINDLKAICRKKNCEKQVVFLGHRIDVYELMSNALALIVSSRFEGFGFITAEAMYNGCLVVGKNTAGTKEQFDNGLKMHGKQIGIRYSDQSDLSGVLADLCANGISHYHETIKMAQETVINLYSSEKNASEIIELYRKVVNKNGE
ncbi:MAG: glycosyltransferase family 4 protein [Bacteroidales bacterium]